MSELVAFGEAIWIAAAAVAVSLLAYAKRIPVPAAGLLLVIAAIASDVFPSLGTHLSTRTVERVAVVALIVILFDGGMRIGRDRFRQSAVPIVSLGVLGTLVTAAIVTLGAKLILGFDWATCAVVGAALAPTDPAVMLSLFRNREVAGRSGTILEGESGTNDPVGIALTLAAVDVAGGGGGSAADAVLDMLGELSIGVAVGIAGGLIVLAALRRTAFPETALVPLWTLALAAAVYGAAAAAHGSGFLATYIAGIVVGDAALPARREIVAFQRSAAGLAEIVVFVALGLTVDVTALGHGYVWLKGLALSGLLLLVVRPIVVAPLLAPLGLRRNERAFIAWCGLKGAVPILLASFAILENVAHSHRIYGVVFIVVACSVLLQGSSIPYVARTLGIPIRSVERPDAF